MADFAASAGMELFHVGKFGIFGTRTPPFLTGSGRVSGWYKPANILLVAGTL
jgi:hypothetical protein